MTDLIQTQDLTKQFVDGKGQELLIVDKLNFHIPENSLTAIFGKSGSGKSTLLHLLGGLEQPSSGQVLFHNQDLHSLPSDELAEWRNQQLGFVFQFHHLLKDFTALENVLMPSLVSKHDKQAAQKRAFELLEQVQLQDRAHHRPPQLSGGEQQRVAMARALMNQPKLILADEPTGNLDHNTEATVLKLLINTCQEQQAALVIATHNLSTQNLVDRCFYLRQYQLYSTAA